MKLVESKEKVKRNRAQKLNLLLKNIHVLMVMVSLPPLKQGLV